MRVGVLGCFGMLGYLVYMCRYLGCMLGYLCWYACILQGLVNIEALQWLVRDERVRRGAMVWLDCA